MKLSLVPLSKVMVVTRTRQRCLFFALFLTCSNCSPQTQTKTDCTYLINVWLSRNQHVIDVLPEMFNKSLFTSGVAREWKRQRQPKNNPTIVARSQSQSCLQQDQCQWKVIWLWSEMGTLGSEQLSPLDTSSLVIWSLLFGAWSFSLKYLPDNSA